jgi:eukaryotic-like serine/threonine-protein kinase
MSESTGDRERRVDEAIAWYYRQAETGAPPAPHDFLNRFADVRTELQSFLADKAAFDRAAGPADPNATVTIDGSTQSVPAGPLGRVRYFGDYELVEEIARGGMGVVYKARQVSLNRTVALKMILSGQLASEADKARFKQEAEAAANLGHPNILPIYEVGEHEGRAYFSMKLVDGASLAESPRPYGRGLVDVLVQVSRAVHFAHQRGILHRDLKPSNVLIDRDGTPYVTDFGLAKRVEGDAGLTQSGALVGTPSYMAPEQARAERQLTTAVDVYSLGAILYEGLTGRPPLRGSGVMDTVLQVLDRDPDDPRQVNPKADRDLGVIALKCLAKEPAKRYESAAALADDLDRWRRGLPIQARPVGPRERLVKWARRHPAPAALSAALVLLVVVALAAITRLYLRSENFRQDAEHERDRARGRLARQYAEKAGTLADQGNPLLGLPWLVEALKTTDGTPQADLHRLHLGLLLNTAPGLVNYWPTATCVAPHPDGRRIAVGEKDGVELVAIGADAPLVPIMKLPGPPVAVAFSPDGRRLLVAAGNDPWHLTTARVFDTDTGAPVTREVKIGRQNGQSATSVRFTADGSVVVALWEGHVNRNVAHVEVFLYDAATLAPIGKPFVAASPERMRGDYVKIDYRTLRSLTPCYRVSPDREDFAGRVQVWDLRTGKALFDPIEPTTSEWETGLELAPGGDRFAMIEGGNLEIRGDASRLQGGKVVHIYDAVTGKSVTRLPHSDDVVRMAFRPDGKVLATLTKDGQLQTWDVATGRPIRTDLGRVTGGSWWVLGYAADGQTLQARSEKGTEAHDAETGANLIELPATDAPDGLVFAPDGVHAASATADGVHLWRRGGGSAGPFLPHGSWVEPTFSSDGRFLVTSGNGVRVWDLAAIRSPSRGLVPPAVVPARSWNLNAVADRAVRLDGDGHVRIFDTRTGESVGPGFRPPGDWRSAELSPDGKLVVTVGWAEGRPSAPSPAELSGRMCGESGRYLWEEPRDVGVWDAATGQAVVAPLRNRTVGHVIVAPDGKSLLVTGRVTDYTPHQKPLEEPANEFTELSVWDLETGEPRGPVVRQPGHLRPVGRTADGKKVLLLVPVGQGPKGPEGTAAQLWDAETLTPDGHLFGATTGFVTEAAVSSDGSRVLTVGFEGDARVWDAATGQSVAGPFRHTSPRVGEKTPLSVAAFSPDGRRVATALGGRYGSAGEVRVWDVATGRPVTPVLRTTAEARFAAFSPDGRLLVAAGRGTVWVWEADTGMPVSPPLPANDPRITPILSAGRELTGPPRFTPDGRRLLLQTDDDLCVIDLVSETRPAAELEPLAKILAGHEVDTAGGFQPLSEAAAVEARDRWRALNPAPRVTPVPEYREMLARSALAQKAWDVALGHLDEVLRNRPDQTSAWSDRADAREMTGRLADAKADLDELIRRADGPTARASRGSVLARLGKYAEAATDYAAAWAVTGNPETGARLALCQWAAGDRPGYRKTCEQLRDRRDEFPRSQGGLALAAMACGLDPNGVEFVRPFIPLMEGLAAFTTGDLIRPLALAYVRTGAFEKVSRLWTGINEGTDDNNRVWAVRLLAMPKAGGPLGLTGVRRTLMAQAVDHWYAREKDALDWAERVIVTELRNQGQ